MDPEVFKALSDGNRLKIIEMLAGGETCACRILEEMSITQPTLSHHMKVLQECGLVTVRKEGRWSYYTLSRERLEEISGYFNGLLETPSAGDRGCCPPDKH
ncbi:MAG: ArsR/SmtB family transcription factor [Methanomethylophilus sp.]|jgi:ArsR family transcriptional regulator